MCMYAGVCTWVRVSTEPEEGVRCPEMESQLWATGHGNWTQVLRKSGALNCQTTSKASIRNPCLLYPNVLCFLFNLGNVFANLSWSPRCCTDTERKLKKKEGELGMVVYIHTPSAWRTTAGLRSACRCTQQVLGQSGRQARPRWEAERGWGRK